MRIQAIRASETLYKAGDQSFAADYAALTKDADVDVVIQAMLTINRWKVAGRSGDDQDRRWRATRRAACRSSATTMLNPRGERDGGRGRGGLTPEQQRPARSRRTDLQRAVLRVPRRPMRMGTPKPELGDDDGAAARGFAARQRPPRLHHQGRAERAGRVRVDGKTYTDVMIPMGSNDDEWVAAVDVLRAQQLRQQRRVRHAGGCRARARRERRAQDALDVARAHRVDARALWSRTAGRLTASHNADAAVGALRLTGWNAGQPQQTGHVVPGRAAEGGDGHRDPVPVTAARRARRCAGMPRPCRAGGAPVAAPGGFPRGYKVEVSQDGVVVDGRGTRCRQRPDDDQHVHAGLRRSSFASP